MTDGTVNIPLLRKAVEWAEVEAMKPPELCEWEQRQFIAEGEEELRQIGRSPECGTCYCIAGFVAYQSPDFDRLTMDEADFASEALGIPSWYNTVAPHLFDSGNTIEDVRRIAERLAGERL